MAHLPPVDMQDLDELKPILAMSEATMGFVPNSVRTMAHMRQLPAAFSVLFGTVMGADVKTLLKTMIQVAPEQNAPEENLPADLLQLVAYCVSVSADAILSGAYRPQHGAHECSPGCPSRKRAQVLNFEDAACFSEAERAVIALALPQAKYPTGQRKCTLTRWANTSRRVKSPDCGGDFRLWFFEPVERYRGDGFGRGADNLC